MKLGFDGYIVSPLGGGSLSLLNVNFSQSPISKASEHALYIKTTLISTYLVLI